MRKMSQIFVSFRHISYAVRALTDIDDFNAQFNTHFDDEEVDTIGGLIMQAFWLFA